MDFRKIEYFKVVAEVSSIARAASLLHVSQPALSRTISQLEHEVGAPLFDRVGRNIVLNENGRILLRYSGRALRALETARIEIAGRQEAEKTVIDLLPRCPLGRPGNIPAQFKRVHPEVVLHFLSAQESDPGIKYDLELFTSEALSNDPEASFLGNERLAAILPVGHRLASRTSVRVGELRDEVFILPAASGLRSMIDEMFQAAGFSPRIGSELTIYTDVLGFVREGLGIAIGPEKTWLGGWPAGSFVAVPIEDVVRTRNIYARCPIGAVPSSSVIALREFLKERLN